ncbi:MAG: hypothetical protein JW803_03640 [Endomicrobiales bacterium]|nr:hypothetical protein [Endomicrobiales bacterium]
MTCTEKTTTAVLTPFLPRKIFSKYADLRCGGDFGGVSVSFAGGFAVVRSGIGEDNTAKAFDVLAGMGVKNVFFLGSCGAVSPLEVGEIMLVQKAFDMTLKNASYPASGLNDMVERAFARDALPFKKGSVCSLPRPEDGCSEIFPAIQKKGVDCIDMEAHFVFNNAKRRGIGSSVVLYVSDIPKAKPFNAELDRQDRAAVSAARDNAVRSVVNMIGDRQWKMSSGS